MLEIYRDNCSSLDADCQAIALLPGSYANMDTWFFNEDKTVTKNIGARNPKSAGLFLVKKGFTVYACNFRGTGYSKYNYYYYNNSWQFWNFSWGHYAYYDVPAFVTFIYDRTGEDVILIGNGTGSVAAAAALAYNRCDI